METKIFAFSVETVEFSKFHGNETKYDKHNIKRFNCDIRGQKSVKSLEKWA